jgi:hypothetical protein
MDDEFRKTVIMMGAFVWLLQHLGDIASLQFGFSGLS